MSIVSSVLTVDRLQAKGQRKIKEDHTDQIGLTHPYGPRLFDAGYDEVAGLVLHAAQIDQQLKEQEISNAVSEYETGGDPLHFEQSPSNWKKITPIYQTWDELAAPVLINFLSREDQLELVAIETTITRISTNDMKALLDMNNPEVNNVNSGIQIAVDTRATLNDYSPFFVDGVKV